MAPLRMVEAGPDHHQRGDGDHRRDLQGDGQRLDGPARSPATRPASRASEQARRRMARARAWSAIDEGVPGRGDQQQGRSGRRSGGRDDRRCERQAQVGREPSAGGRPTSQPPTSIRATRTIRARVSRDAVHAGLLPCRPRRVGLHDLGQQARDPLDRSGGSPARRGTARRAGQGLVDHGGRRRCGRGRGSAPPPAGPCRRPPRRCG